MKLRQKQQLEGIFYSFFLTFEKKTMWLPAAKHSQNENKTLGFGPKLFRMCYVVVVCICEELQTPFFLGPKKHNSRTWVIFVITRGSSKNYVDKMG